MYELIQVGKDTFYMDCPAKVGFYRTADDEAVIIDSGSDKDAGKKVKKILDENGWKLAAIYNTHSHADHTGGNRYLQSQTGCRIYATRMERSIVENPFLEPVTLYGGYALSELNSKFLMAKESDAEILTGDALPDGMEIVPLPGHSYDMVGFRTKDSVVFLADSLASEQTLEKYQVGFLYDVRAFIGTLEMIKTLQADCFVPSHAPAMKDISPLAQMNIDNVKKIADVIAGILSSPKTFDDLLEEVFGAYGISMNIFQNVLIGSTVKSYLSYLIEEGRVSYFFEGNRMFWKAD